MSSEPNDEDGDPPKKKPASKKEEIDAAAEAETPDITESEAPPSKPTPKTGKKRTSDLVPGSFPEMGDWSTHGEENAEKMFDFARAKCQSAIVWYFSKKKMKRVLGYWFRGAPIVFIAIAGVIPVLHEIFENAQGEWTNPAWSTIAVAVAALLISWDRFGGFTSGWVRYIRAAQELTTLQTDYCIKWEASRLAGISAEDPNEHLQSQVDLCSDYLRAVDEVIKTETDKWAHEFRVAIAVLEKERNDHAQPPKTDTNA